jgi:hypothetical protein
MNAPLAQDIAPAPGQFDPCPDVRQDIWENFGALAVYCEIGRRYAEIADDAGLAYSVRCAAAHVKAIIGSFNQLVETNREGAE